MKTRLNSKIFPLIVCAAFAACYKSDQKELINNQWKVVELKRAGASEWERGPAEFYLLNFSSNRTYTIFLDVNRCGGNMILSSDGVAFERPSCTEACCDSPFADQLMTAWLQIRRFRIVNDTLLLTGRDSIKALKSAE